MIHDVDESLGVLLGTALRGIGDVAISFDAPTAAWISARGKKPAVNLWLFDVREDSQARQGDVRDIRDETGRVIARQPPGRKYDLAYLVSAWADDAAAEHRLLGAVLAAAPDRDFLPPEALRGSLLAWEMPVGVRMAPSERTAGHWDLWAALGVPPRSSIELRVTAPLVPELITEIGPPADQFALGMGQQRRMGPPKPEPNPMGTPATGKRWPRANITEP